MPPELLPPVVATAEDRAWAHRLLDGLSEDSRRSTVLGRLMADVKLSAVNLPPKGAELRQALALVEVYEEVQPHGPERLFADLRPVEFPASEWGSTPAEAL